MVLELGFSQQGSAYTSFSSRGPEEHVTEPLKSSVGMFFFMGKNVRVFFTSSVLHSSANPSGLSPLAQELYDFSARSPEEVPRPLIGTFGKFYPNSSHLFLTTRHSRSLGGKFRFALDVRKLVESL